MVLQTQAFGSFGNLKFVPTLPAEKMLAHRRVLRKASREDSACCEVAGGTDGERGVGSV